MVFCFTCTRRCWISSAKTLATRTPLQCPIGGDGVRVVLFRRRRPRAHLVLFGQRLSSAPRSTPDPTAIAAENGRAVVAADQPEAGTANVFGLQIGVGQAEQLVSVRLQQ